jgi:predicted RNA binding protein YcfA (HicA-like mRNA interferase family)
MSQPLPLVSGRKVVIALQRAGYYIRRQRGSHIRLYHQQRLPVTVPDHKEIDRRTLKSILRTANITTEEFIELL